MRNKICTALIVAMAIIVHTPIASADDARECKKLIEDLEFLSERTRSAVLRYAENLTSDNHLEDHERLNKRYQRHQREETLHRDKIKDFNQRLRGTTGGYCDTDNKVWIEPKGVEMGQAGQEARCEYFESVWNRHFKFCSEVFCEDAFGHTECTEKELKVIEESMDRCMDTSLSDELGKDTLEYDIHDCYPSPDSYLSPWP